MNGIQHLLASNKEAGARFVANGAPAQCLLNLSGRYAEKHEWDVTQTGTLVPGLQNQPNA